MASQVATLVAPAILSQAQIAANAPVSLSPLPSVKPADVVGVNLPDITVPVALVLLFLWLRK